MGIACTVAELPPSRRQNSHGFSTILKQDAKPPRRSILGSRYLCRNPSGRVGIGRSKASHGDGWLLKSHCVSKVPSGPQALPEVTGHPGSILGSLLCDTAWIYRGIWKEDPEFQGYPSTAQSSSIGMSFWVSSHRAIMWEPQLSRYPTTSVKKSRVKGSDVMIRIAAPIVGGALPKDARDEHPDAIGDEHVPRPITAAACLPVRTVAPPFTVLR